jgi:hypothetical protein
MKYLDKLLAVFYKNNKSKEKLSALKLFTDDIDKISRTTSDIEKLLNEIANIKSDYDRLGNLILSKKNENDRYLKIFESNQKSLQDLSSNISVILKIQNSHNKKIGEITHFKNTVVSSQPEIYQKMNIEEHRLAVDYKHKLSLTLLRVFQIPILVFITYWAATLSVTSIQYFNLTPPKMPISLTPNYVKNAAKNTESVTNPGITPDQ